MPACLHLNGINTLFLTERKSRGASCRKYSDHRSLLSRDFEIAVKQTVAEIFKIFNSDVSSA